MVDSGHPWNILNRRNLDECAGDSHDDLRFKGNFCRTSIQLRSLQVWIYRFPSPIALPAVTDRATASPLYSAFKPCFPQGNDAPQRCTASRSVPVTIKLGREDPRLKRTHVIKRTRFVVSNEWRAPVHLGAANRNHQFLIRTIVSVSDPNVGAQ